MLAGRDGEVWVATEDGLYRKSADASDVLRISGPDGELVGGDVNALAQADDGRIWVGTEKGIYVTTSASPDMQRLAVAADAGLAHPTVLGMIF